MSQYCKAQKKLGLSDQVSLNAAQVPKMGYFHPASHAPAGK